MDRFDVPMAVGVRSLMYVYLIHIEVGMGAALRKGAGHRK